MLLCLASMAQAQMIVKGKVTNTNPHDVLLFNVPYENGYYPQNNIEIRPDSMGEFDVKLAIQQPQIFFLRCGDKFFRLYGEPGKTLIIQFDARQPGSMTFHGDLATENTFRSSIGLSDYIVSSQLHSDTITTPSTVLSLILQHQPSALDRLERLDKTSAAFQRITRGDIRYFPISKLWDLFFQLPASKTKVKKDDWIDAMVKAYSTQSLSDTEALDSYHYQNAITYYPRYIMMKEGKALAEKILHMPIEELKAKGERYVEYTLWEHALTGRSLERAKASFIIHGVLQGEMAYLNEAYNDFRRSYPSSTYRKKVDEVMQPYLEARATENRFEFITDNRYKDLASIIASHPGRILYIDIWGTWCGPCREQFSYVRALKERFKDEPIDFVYVAIEKPEASVNVWKETVSFYNLTGKHILAGKELAACFRELYKSEGSEAMVFPSYLLVDKDGKLVTAHANQPSSGEELYKQIKTVLRQK